MTPKAEEGLGAVQSVASVADRVVSAWPDKAVVDLARSRAAIATAMAALMADTWDVAVSSYRASPAGFRNDDELRKEWRRMDPVGYGAYRKAELALERCR